MREDSAANWEKSITGRPEQIAAVTSECRLTVVSAGAGTGKTHTLSQRFAWILARHPDCAVDEILVLTFTEKAAREMQERIATTVGNLYEAHKDELKHLKESVRRMGDAYISTIHSFAMKVIRESALSLDIDPTASIVPEPKEDLWWENYAYALDAMSITPLEHLLDAEWRQRADDLFRSQPFADLVNNYRPEGLAEAAKNACGTLGSAGYAPEELWNWPEDRLLEQAASMEPWFDHVWECWMEDILPYIEEELLASTAAFPQNLLAVYGRFREAPKTKENKTAFAQALLAEGLANLTGGKKTTKDRIAERLGVPLKAWRDDALPALRKATPPSDEERALSLFLNRVAALGWHCWDSVRRGEGMLSMNDLIAYAGEAVKKEPAYAKKFKYILVDEFQDTDALQDELISSLWNEENKLFLVGDLKQSIYRFRHADLRLFQKYIELAKSDPQHNCYISLDRSFRTKGALLSDFNKIFSDLWTEGLEPGSAMAYEALEGPDDAQWWEERNKPVLQPVLEAMLAVKPNPGKKREEENPQEKEQNKESIAATRIRLFQKLAERFRSLKESDGQVWEKSGDQPGHRDIRWNDFALLVPTRTSYPAVEQAFENAGVPYVLCTSKNYFARGEVGDVANLIQLLNDPQNPLCLGGWIACPFSGVPAGTMEDLMRLASEKEGGVRSLADAVQDALPETWREVGRLRKIALLEGPSAAILELLKKPAYLAHYAPDARRNVIMNLPYLAGIASEYERSEGVSLSGFADYLLMLTISQQQKEEPDVSDETQDAVQVLTVHASKGLEYPIVAVLCDEGGSRVGQSLFVSKDYGVVAKKLPRAAGGQKDEAYTTVGAWYQENEDQKASSEQQRLWYVALTRARDKLFLCGTSKEDKEGALSIEQKETFFKKALDSLAIDPAGIVVGERENRRTKSNAEAAAVPEILELPVVSPAKLARLSASAYAMISWCPNAYRIAYRQGRNLQWTVSSGEESGGADFGSLAHWILARWNFNEDSLPQWLPQEENDVFTNVERQIPPSLRSEFRDRETRRDMLAMLCAFARTEAVGRLRALAAQESGKRFTRETPFRVQAGDLLLVGSIDLYYEDENGAHVRDWKTTGEDYAPSEYYDAQLDFYAYAVWRYREQKKSPALPLDKAILYTRQGEKEISPRHIAADEIAEIGARIHGAAELALSGEFSKQYDKCGRCPWRRDCEKS